MRLHVSVEVSRTVVAYDGFEHIRLFLVRFLDQRVEFLLQILCWVLLDGSELRGITHDSVQLLEVFFFVDDDIHVRLVTFPYAYVWIVT